MPRVEYRIKVSRYSARAEARTLGGRSRLCNSAAKAPAVAVARECAQQAGIGRAAGGRDDLQEGGHMRECANLYLAHACGAP